jgi:5-formyltetrahydrofolate cyclo-ligase
MSDISNQKSVLRAQLRERLKSIPSETKTALSEQACEILFTNSSYDHYKSVLLYMPLQDELDVRFFMTKALQQGRRLALPRYLPDREKYAAYFIGNKPLKPGRFGVLEPETSMPVPLNQLDLIVVPGLGFDPRGRRLGRGKGFYDRMLSEASGVKCGICFDEQIVENIPAEPHDVAMDFVATPTRWLDCRGSTPDLR